MSSLMTRSAAILYGSSLHYLDHLAPLSSLLEIPLLVDDEELYSLAKKYYPKLRLTLCGSQEIYFYAAENFDYLITCRPRPLFDVDFFLPQTLLKKKLKTIWCPHGNSDKGRSSFLMEGLKLEDLLLIYGRRMHAFIRQKGVRAKCLKVGNYRYRYFLENKRFYENILQKEKLFFPCGKKTILYAPTWKDYENSSSLETFLDPLLQSPKDINLIIKPHPNLFLTQPLEMEKLMEDAKRTKNVRVIKDLPVIYPLLSVVDGYLGDMSSIGYDFLTFQKPLFFLTAPNHLSSKSSYFLHQCGLDLSKENPEDLMKTISLFFQKKEDLFVSMRKKIYRETFSPKSQLEKLKLFLTAEKSLL